MENKSLTRVVKRIKLANYLSNHGIDFEYSRVDYENPKFRVFIYKRTEKLEELINQYYEEGKQKGKIS